jgi:hypothetical protein
VRLIEAEDTRNHGSTLSRLRARAQVDRSTPDNRWTG